ncbi:MAG: hypothetical protein WCQ66_00120 [Sphaerochaetaceae bacterium]|jgi:hypothetical protein
MSETRGLNNFRFVTSDKPKVIKDQVQLRRLGGGVTNNSLVFALME